MPPWLILVVLLSKKVQVSFVSHDLSLGAVILVLQRPRLCTAGGGDHHLHWHHSNHDWFLSCLPIHSFGPFYHQTSHTCGPCKVKISFPGLHSAVSHTCHHHHHPFCCPRFTPSPSYFSSLEVFIYLSPAVTPQAMPSPSTLSEDTTIFVFPLPLPYGASILSVLSSQPIYPHVSLPMHTGGLYMYISRAGL